MLSGLRNTGPTSVSTYNNIPKHVNTLEWAKPRCCRSLQRRRSVDGRVYTNVCQRTTGCSLSAWLLECRRLPQGSSECQNFFFRCSQEQPPYAGCLNNLLDERSIPDLTVFFYNFQNKLGTEDTLIMFEIDVQFQDLPIFSTIFKFDSEQMEELQRKRGHFQRKQKYQR